MKFALLIFYTALSLLGNAQIKQGLSGNTITLDRAVSFEMPFPHKNIPELFKNIKALNDKLIYVAFLDKGDAFSVSKYQNGKAVSIDAAFYQTVKTRAIEGNGYKLIDFGIYKKLGKILRFKISEITYGNGKNVYCLMDYFMKGQASDTLYEIKIACSLSEIDANFKKLEHIATTFKFL